MDTLDACSRTASQVRLMHGAIEIAPEDKVRFELRINLEFIKRPAHCAMGHPLDLSFRNNCVDVAFHWTLYALTYIAVRQHTDCTC